MILKQPYHSSPLKYKALIETLIWNIGMGEIAQNERMPSISKVSEMFSLSKVTVDRAYRELKKQGYITSIAGKGYYVLPSKSHKLKILVVVNELNSFKRHLYKGFTDTLKHTARVDIQLHHYNAKLCKEIIEANLGKYQFYLIAPHFLGDTSTAEILAVFENIPCGKLVLLDKPVSGLQTRSITVYQDFERDIFDELHSADGLLNKYERITLIISLETRHLHGFVAGLKRFCDQVGKELIMVDGIPDVVLSSTAYIVSEEEDLGELIKKIKSTNLQLGFNVGIISFNDTTIAELLDISVFTTNFILSGILAANMILKGELASIRNSFKLIKRSSL